jgi:hypothetical protein
MKINDIITESTLDELNIKTLKSYVGKRLARNPNIMAPNPHGKTKKQRSGIELAMDKIIPGSAIKKPKVASQENVETIPEASSPAQQAAIAINMKKRGKKPKHDESVMEADATDTVSMDIPLLLRMMEYAREDAKTDEDLHDVAEKMIELSKHHDYLCMDNYNEIVGSAGHDNVEESCPHCGGLMYEASLMNEKKDACYYKVKSRYKVWPSAYASGALVKCRKAGAKNWGNKSK